MQKLSCNTFAKCAENLISVSADCTTDCSRAYIEQIPGIDIYKLSKTVNNQVVTGVALGKLLISNSGSMLSAHLEDITTDGTTLKTSAQLCSVCNFTSNYIKGGGVTVTNSTVSNMATLTISQIEMLVNVSGDHTVVFDDGVKKLTTTQTFVGQAVKKIILATPFTTSERQVKIYLQDSEIAMSEIHCAQESGCGCGGYKKNNPNASDNIMLSGLLLGSPSKTQYGIKVCATSGCSSELMLCQLATAYPNKVTQSLLPLIAKQYYMELQTSARNNHITMKMDSEEIADLIVYWNRQAEKQIFGSKLKPGLIQTAKQYLKTSKDNCVVCKSKIRSAWAHR